MLLAVFVFLILVEMTDSDIKFIIVLLIFNQQGSCLSECLWLVSEDELLCIDIHSGCFDSGFVEKCSYRAVLFPAEEAHYN